MSETETVDWRDFEEPQPMHMCNCDHCDFWGEPEGDRFRPLASLTVDGTEYVTDRYLALPRSLAPRGVLPRLPTTVRVAGRPCRAPLDHHRRKTR